MDELLKADIFFFITSVAVVVVAVLMAVALVYAIRILRDVSDAVALLKKEAESVVRHATAIKDAVKDKAEYVGRFFASFVGVTTARMRKKKTKDAKDTRGGKGE